MAKSLRWLGPGVFVGSLAPLGLLAWRGAQDQLGANPISEMLNELGLVALVFLMATLACTPAQKVFGWTWAVRIRRMLGLFAFFYATLHLATYVVLDQGLKWGALIEDILKRNFILVGALALLLMAPLAVTSTQSMVRRLGFVRWKRLHRLAYASAALAVVHFFWRVKKDHTEPVFYGAILLILLGLRALARLPKLRETNSGTRP